MGNNIFQLVQRPSIKQSVTLAQKFVLELENAFVTLQLTAASAKYDNLVYGYPARDEVKAVQQCARILLTKANFKPVVDLLKNVTVHDDPINMVKARQAEYHQLMQ
ncbi:hypothetical protein AH06_134 [Erwinia phage AH06]|nr:hypothetical protein AH06_134 [Erwinia phage AH06]